MIQPDKIQLRSAVKSIGPTAVAIDASNDDFKKYDGSYIYGFSPFEPKQCTDVTNHGVLVVGYGTMKNYCNDQICHQNV